MDRDNKSGNVTKGTCFLRLNKTGMKKLLTFCGILILTVFLIIGIPIIINELYKLNKGYLTLWGAADVLAFYAVILSEIITIGALIATIYFTKKDTEKQIKLSKAQTNTPFFLITKVHEANSIVDDHKSLNGQIWKKEYFINQHGNNQGQIIIVLSNIGEGIALSPAYNINLSSTTMKEHFPAFINKGDLLEIRYNLKNLLESKFGESIFPNGFNTFDSSITLNYQNALGIKFNQEIRVEHEWNMERNSVIVFVSISAQNVEF